MSGLHQAVEEKQAERAGGGRHDRRQPEPVEPLYWSVDSVVGLHEFQEGYTVFTAAELKMATCHLGRTQAHRTYNFRSLFAGEVGLARHKREYCSPRGAINNNTSIEEYIAVTAERHNHSTFALAWLALISLTLKQPESEAEHDRFYATFIGLNTRTTSVRNILSAVAAILRHPQGYERYLQTGQRWPLQNVSELSGKDLLRDDKKADDLINRTHVYVTTPPLDKVATASWLEETKAKILEEEQEKEKKKTLQVVIHCLVHELCGLVKWTPPDEARQEPTEEEMKVAGVHCIPDPPAVAESPQLALMASAWQVQVQNKRIGELENERNRVAAENAQLKNQLAQLRQQAGAGSERSEAVVGEVSGGAGISGVPEGQADEAPVDAGVLRQGRAARRSTVGNGSSTTASSSSSSSPPLSSPASVRAVRSRQPTSPTRSHKGQRPKRATAGKAAGGKEEKQDNEDESADDSEDGKAGSTSLSANPQEKKRGRETTNTASASKRIKRSGTDNSRKSPRILKEVNYNPDTSDETAEEVKEDEEGDKII